MGDVMRCPVCEELMELIDTCEACLRLQREPAPLKRTGRRSASSQPAGICIRGHVMIMAGRWRCKQCEAMYNERKRQQRRAEK
jgi:hypothetical protein